MDRTDQRTETDERVAENATAAPRTTAVGKGSNVPLDPATGLPEGLHDDDRSPLDPGAPLNPMGVGSEDRSGGPKTKIEREIFESASDYDRDGRTES
jgi:hypothetical protein